MRMRFLALLAPVLLAGCGAVAAAPSPTAPQASPAATKASQTPPKAPQKPASSGPKSSAPLAPSPSDVKSVMTSTVEVGVPDEHFKLDLKPVTVPDGHGGWLTAAHGTRYPTADAYGQLIFFWHNKTFIGWDASYEAIQSSLAASGPGYFTVKYAHFGPKDPVCCPTLPPVLITYRWTGSRLAASGQPPKYLGTATHVKLKKN